MTHEESWERLDAWLDGELDARASAAVSAHFASCAECASKSARSRRLGTALFAAPAGTDPRSNEAFVARVMARVEADSLSTWERIAARFLAPALGAALAGALFMISTPNIDEDAPLGVSVAAVDEEYFLEAAP